jgi:hypothetical protein
MHTTTATATMPTTTAPPRHRKGRPPRPGSRRTRARTWPACGAAGGPRAAEAPSPTQAAGPPTGPPKQRHTPSHTRARSGGLMAAGSFGWLDVRLVRLVRLEET